LLDSLNRMLGTNYTMEQAIAGGWTAAKVAAAIAAGVGASNTQSQDPVETSNRLYAAQRAQAHTPITITNQDGTTRSFDPYGSISVVPMRRNQIAYTGNPTGAGLPDAQGNPTQSFRSSPVGNPNLQQLAHYNELIPENPTGANSFGLNQGYTQEELDAYRNRIPPASQGYANGGGVHRYAAGGGVTSQQVFDFLSANNIPLTIEGLKRGSELSGVSLTDIGKAFGLDYSGANPLLSANTPLNQKAAQIFQAAGRRQKILQSSPQTTPSFTQQQVRDFLSANNLPVTAEGIQRGAELAGVNIYDIGRSFGLDYDGTDAWMASNNTDAQEQLRVDAQQQAQQAEAQRQAQQAQQAEAQRQAQQAQQASSSVIEQPGPLSPTPAAWVAPVTSQSSMNWTTPQIQQAADFFNSVDINDLQGQKAIYDAAQRFGLSDNQLADLYQKAMGSGPIMTSANIHLWEGDNRVSDLTDATGEYVPVAADTPWAGPVANQTNVNFTPLERSTADQYLQDTGTDYLSVYQTAKRLGLGSAQVASLMGIPVETVRAWVAENNLDPLDRELYASISPPVVPTPVVPTPVVPTPVVPPPVVPPPVPVVYPTTQPIPPPISPAGGSSTVNTYPTVQPMARERNTIPFTGDFLKYGQGPEHLFYDQVNPLYNGNGSVWDPSATGANQPLTQSNEYLSYVPPTTGPSQSSINPTNAFSTNIANGQYAPNSNAWFNQNQKNLAQQGVITAARGGPIRGGLSSLHPQGPRGRVSGPGTGQSDSIPAVLSDGEYIMDAGTVADLGDGSTQAGTAALDKMRQNIRKHKRSAPISKIPPKAKPPMAYFEGGN
jgi:DNA-binding transcriptional MerR regulator